ncbi:dihydrofolate reductase family protein [Brevibacterium marinum]|uniref:Dihydrofolate reductase n=1 Tax=Brevibacterium marinum TaxID=418643 RepID=A0A846S970_9MICO|nr:dihydrofolate reductase family protein [Brevibacterium marinum]NJC57892.1 dihydrofolate reductase [Brevibacterium marinum]
MTNTNRYRYYTATTLDGFLADEHDSLAWLFKQDIDVDGPGSADALIADVGAQVMGATTYRWVLENHPDWLPQMPTFVFTHRGLKPANEHVIFLAGEPTDHRAAIEEAAGEKDVWMMGGGNLAGSFASAGMLDEIKVSIAPVMLGSGRPLFDGAFDLSLRNCERNRDFLTATFDVVGPLGSR